MTKYAATIHTITIEPTAKTPEGLSSIEELDCIQSWARLLDHHRPAWCRGVMRNNDERVRLTINPHRLNQAGNGKYLFEHIPLSQYRERMNAICAEAGMEPDYIIRRVDICLDTDQPYTQTQKLARLILLMLAEDNDLANRFESIDPLTLEPKAITLSNGKKSDRTIEVEHYNRELIDQTDSNNKPIRNRVELRAMGRQAGVDRTEESIARGWLERLKALRQMDYTTITDQLNERIMNGWTVYKTVHGKDNAHSFYAYLRTVEPHIYTRQQAVNLFALYGYENPCKALSNFMSKNGKPLILFEDTEIMDELNAMIEALMHFLKN